MGYRSPMTGTSANHDDDETDTAPTQGGLFEGPAVNLKLGHRQRLRQRFMKGGAEAMPDYELLELVLFRAIERRDTKDLAKRLLARFGSFAEVINAPEGRLREVADVGDAVITELKLVRAASLRLMKTSLLEKPLLTSWQSVLDYLTAAQAYETREQFRILFLDKKINSSPTKCRARARSIIRPFMCAKW